ncbi:MAG: hypothetical protein WCI67_00025 [Chloroflexales bacterium]
MSKIFYYHSETWLIWHSVTLTPDISLQVAPLHAPALADLEGGELASAAPSADGCPTNPQVVGDLIDGQDVAHRLELGHEHLLSLSPLVIR